MLRRDMITHIVAGLVTNESVSSIMVAEGLVIRAARIADAIIEEDGEHQSKKVYVPTPTLEERPTPGKGRKA